MADAAYDLPLFQRVLRDHGIRFYVRPLPRSAASLGGVPGSPFLYDEGNDLYTCTDGKTLRPRNLERSVGGLHWMYYADGSDCPACPMRAQCVGKGRAKRLERSYFWREIRENLMKLDSPMYSFLICETYCTLPLYCTVSEERWQLYSGICSEHQTGRCRELTKSQT